MATTVWRTLSWQQSQGLLHLDFVLAATVWYGIHMGYFLDYLLCWSVYIESDFLWSHLLPRNELISTVHFFTVLLTFLYSFSVALICIPL